MQKQLPWVAFWALFFGMMSFVGCHRFPFQKHAEHSSHQEEKKNQGEAISYTFFTSQAEYFIEHLPLVAEQPTEWLVHMTWLGKVFTPVLKGKVTLRFLQRGQVVTSLVADKIARKGIFKIKGKAPVAGEYQAKILFGSRDKKDTHGFFRVVVYASTKDARKAHPHQKENHEPISFLKEQQWNIPFSTKVVTHGTLEKGLQVFGEGFIYPSSLVEIKAPITGKIGGMSSSMVEGLKVVKGQRLFWIEPLVLVNRSLPSLKQAIESAKTNLQLSLIQWKRVKKMSKAKAVGSWKVSQAQTQVSQNKTTLAAAQEQLQLFYRSRQRGAGRNHSFTIRAEISGVLIKQSLSNGSFVLQGQSILTYGNLQKMRLVAHLPEQYAHDTQEILSVSYRHGLEKFRKLPLPSAIGVAIQSDTHTLPLYFDIPNPGHLKHEQHLEFKIHFSKQEGLVIPFQSIVDDQGTSVVFVQMDGEHFEKRKVKLGIQDGENVLVEQGVQKGERVVVQGAYEILLTQALKQSNPAGHHHAH